MISLFLKLFYYFLMFFEQLWKRLAPLS
jgi:hypothetical protein